MKGKSMSKLAVLLVAGALLALFAPGPAQADPVIQVQCTFAGPGFPVLISPAVVDYTGVSPGAAHCIPGNPVATAACPTATPAGAALGDPPCAACLEALLNNCGCIKNECFNVADAVSFGGVHCIFECRPRRPKGKKADDD